MEAGQIKKIEDYVALLAKQADENQDDSQSIQGYIKAADILLALASKAPNQSVWEKYTKQAEGYQQKAKQRISSPKSPQTGNQSQGIQKVISNGDTQSGEKESSSDSNTQAPEEKVRRLSRLRGVFHAVSPLKNVEEETTNTAAEPPKAEPYSVPDEEELVRRRLMSPTHSFVHPIATQQSQTPAQQNNPSSEKKTGESSKPSYQTMIPYQQYLTLLAENRNLKETIKKMVSEPDYASLEAKNKELTETLGMMVPREEYEKLQDKLVDMVPKSMYLELQRSLAAMVPKEMYLDAEARISQLKAQLDASIPKRVLDDLATRVTILGAGTASDSDELQEGSESPPLVNYRKWSADSDQEDAQK